MLNASDFLIASGGELSEAWFHEVVATDVLAAWISNAVGETSAIPDAGIKERAQVAYVYSQAYSFLATDMASRPMVESVEGTYRQQFSKTQLNLFSDRARTWMESFKSLSQKGVNKRRRTHAVRFTTEF